MKNSEATFKAMNRVLEDRLNEARDSGSRRFIISIMEVAQVFGPLEDYEPKVEQVITFLESQIDRTTQEGHYMSKERGVCIGIMEEFNGILGHEKEAG